MAVGFSDPRYKEGRTFDFAQDELLLTVKSALNDLGWPHKILWVKEFEARTPKTNWSWHHDFSVAFPSNGMIAAESISAYQEMFFEFGRNRRNVDRFFASLEQLMGRKLQGNS